MFSRIAFLLIALFWVTMNFLLWRSEYGGPSHQGGVVPAEVVWRKIITSPDNSSLDILHQGKKAGYARWAVNERHDSGPGLVGGLPVNGPADRPQGYRLDLEGNVVPDTNTGRIYFDLSLELDTNRDWQKLMLRITLGKSSVMIRSRAADQTVHIITDDDGNRLDRTMTFAELENPEALAGSLALPLPVPLDALGASEMSRTTPGLSLSALGLDWEARSDWINIGHTAARAYRLQTRLLDKWQIVIMISPVGEILRVELPGGWVLASDQTTGF
jgi:hypothetical protein